MIAIVAAVLAGYWVLRRPSPSSESSNTAARPDAAAPTPLPSPSLQGTKAPGPPTGFGRPMAVIDLNSASLAELETLPSFTPEYARKVIAGRPYRSMSDLERAGIPRQVLEQISPPAIIRLDGRGPLPNSPPPPNKKP